MNRLEIAKLGVSSDAEAVKALGTTSPPSDDSRGLLSILEPIIACQLLLLALVAIIIQQYS
ncbi:hypothetical protein [Noviherbaspirillum pedocola]|uniref:Uncharacterized protein n=1 Tax=Noviherbaspirillum pedocola TaxID=2801341 RepID=A0A934SW81_9BURK|nr:hypothetical protein [Noviherbaspirillum pedocola]MBK4732998.1 hypothetical protein [Noviherbaspirillum pedocola]